MSVYRKKDRQGNGKSLPGVTSQARRMTSRMFGSPLHTPGKSWILSSGAYGRRSWKNGAIKQESPADSACTATRCAFGVKKSGVSWGSTVSEVQELCNSTGCGAYCK